MIKKKNKTILVATSDNKVIREIVNLFKNDNRFNIITLFYGNKLIYECLKLEPDVVVIENGFAELSSEIIITALKCLDELENTRILCLVNKIDDNAAISLGADDYLEIGKVTQANLRRKILSLLNVPSVLQETYINQRQWPRVNVNIPTQIEYIPSEENAQVQRGIAYIKDISMGGAQLLHQEFIDHISPHKNDRITLHANTYPLDNWHSVSQIVRSQDDAIGLEFVDISNDDTVKINTFFQA